MTLTDTTHVELRAFGELIGLGRPGGQGRVHSPEFTPAGLPDGPLVVKLYRRPPPVDDASVLSEMVSWEDSLDGVTRDRLTALAAWPLAVVDAGGRPVGIAMRDVSDRFAVPFLVPSGRRQHVLLALEHLLGSDSFLRQRGLDVALDTPLRALVAARISASLAFLHQHGIAVGDLAPSNLLLGFGSGDVRVCFIDCDSMVFRGRRALPAVETGDWNLPAEFREPSGTRAADAYKLGLAVLRLFARSHDARTAAPHLRHLPEQVRDLLHRALSADAPNRPPAGEWARALTRLAGAEGLEVTHPGPQRQLRSRPPHPQLPPGSRAPRPQGQPSQPPPPAAFAPRPARRRGPRPQRSGTLRRAVIALWLVALALAAAAIVTRLGASPSVSAPVRTIFYPEGPGGRVLPSPGFLQAGGAQSQP